MAGPGVSEAGHWRHRGADGNKGMELFPGKQKTNRGRGVSRSRDSFSSSARRSTIALFLIQDCRGIPTLVQFAVDLGQKLFGVVHVFHPTACGHS